MGHLAPPISRVMGDVWKMLRQVFHTSNPMTVPISAAVTGAFVSLKRMMRRGLGVANLL